MDEIQSPPFSSINGPQRPALQQQDAGASSWVRGCDVRPKCRTNGLRMGRHPDSRASGPGPTRLAIQSEINPLLTARLTASVRLAAPSLPQIDAT